MRTDHPTRCSGVSWARRCVIRDSSKITGWAALFTSSAFSTYGAEAAAHVVAMVPVILIFIVMQKWFIRGLTDGILKM